MYHSYELYGRQPCYGFGGTRLAAAVTPGSQLERLDISYVLYLYPFERDCCLEDRLIISGSLEASPASAM